MDRIPEDIKARIEELKKYYIENIEFVDTVRRSIFAAIRDDIELKKIYHTVKSRNKDPESFKHRLERIFYQYKKSGKEFDITKENLFDTITDVAGIRILHIHTEQILQIKPILERIFDQLGYQIISGPKANTWDIEYENYYKKVVGIETTKRNSLYTSIHYILKFNDKLIPKCELQIRTLIEETWGEVSHIINYPDETNSVSCKEQIRALARVTSSGTRLIDSIFRSKDEYIDLTKKTH